MHRIKIILKFYQKLFLSALLFAGLIGLLDSYFTGVYSLKTVGISYMLTGLLFHYFIYEVKNSNELYFYYNLGLSRMTLWLVTFISGIIIGLIFILV